jgi:hypothetical protein
MLSQLDLDEIAKRNQSLKQLKERWKPIVLSIPVPISDLPTDDVDKLLEEIGNLRFTVSLMNELNRRKSPTYELHGGLGDK